MQASKNSDNKELPNPEQVEMLTRLTAELHRLNGHRFILVHNSLWRLVLFQFLRGLAFGLGSVIGATLLFSGLVWWLSQFEFVPLIGEWMGQLVAYIEQASGE